MVAKKDFEIGDLVWAKMKGFSFWPAKCVKPPPILKKGAHYVYFFGSENHAWIVDENIMHHSEEMLQSTPKKQSASLRLAIQQIIAESASAPKKAKSPVKEKESPIKSPEVSTSSSDRKITKVRKSKVKTESPKVQKKTTPKRPFLDESSSKRSSLPRKLSKKAEGYSGLISNTPPNIGFKSVAIIKPLDDRAHSLAPSVKNRDYFELQPGPSLDLQNTSAAIQAKNITATRKKIGFIGLGTIGQRLVKNLINSGHSVTIWNRTADKCVDFYEIGALSAQTPCDVVEKCDIIFSCVSGPDASKGLVFGNYGILSGLEKNSGVSKGYVEMTTIDPVTSQEIAEAISYKGGKYLEAAISGSRQMAEDGALLILGAGDRDLFTDCESCFFALSRNAYYLSDEVGSGSKLNLILSMLMGVSHAALAEAMALVECCKLSQTNFLEILELGPLSSPLLSDKGKAIVAHNFAPNTTLKYQQKDLNMALSLGNKCNQPMQVTAQANELFKHARLLHYSDHDVAAVYLGTKH